MLLRRIVPALLGVLLAGGAAAVEFGRAQVTVESRGRSLGFSVEVATTPEQRQRGLMFRDSLPADGGMLFVFPEERVAHMWMKDTRISLDMLFLGADGRILKIAARAVPESTDVISSGVAARGVLELPGGAAERLGIREGDRVVHPALSGH